MVWINPSCVDNKLKHMDFIIGSSDTLWRIGGKADDVTVFHFASIIKISGCLKMEDEMASGKEHDRY